MLPEYYSTLFRKKLETETAREQEKKQTTERFTILDPARIPAVAPVERQTGGQIT